MTIFTTANDTLADTKAARWLLPVTLLLAVSGVVLVVLGGWHAAFLTLNDAGRALNDTIAASLTQCGDTLFALSLFLLLAKRHPALLWHAVVAAVVAALLSRGIKVLMAEPRPGAVLDIGTFRLVGPLLRHGSFPSGHTVTAFVSAATLACYVARPWRFVLLLIAAAVGAGRVVVGAHWPIDVIAGATIGVASAYLGLLAARRWNWGLQATPHRALVLILALCTLVQLIRRPDYPDARPLVIAVSLVALLVAARDYLFNRSPPPTNS